MLRTTGLAIFAFIYPCADRHWQQDSEVCPPAIRMPPAKSGIKDHVATLAALRSNNPTNSYKLQKTARCDQPRALDLAARGGRKLESIPDAIMGEVLARISPIFE